MQPQNNTYHDTYWTKVWRAFRSHPLGYFSLWVVVAFALVAIYAPFLASSKPIAVHYDGVWYFPLFRYLFFTGFYTKGIDIFFNIMIFTFPTFLLALIGLRKHRNFQKCMCGLIIFVQCLLFIKFFFFPIEDPESDSLLNKQREVALKKNKPDQKDWDFDLKYMNDYAKLNLVTQNIVWKEQYENLKPYFKAYSNLALQRWLAQNLPIKRSELLVKQQKVPSTEELEELILKETDPEKIQRIESPPILWIQNQNLYEDLKESYQDRLKSNPNDLSAKARLKTIEQRNRWLQQQEGLVTFILMPLVRTFHWEDNAGGQQALNAYLPWWDLTRINRKDLMSALIFGTRISLVVGIASVALAYLIGIPIGAFAGYYGGSFDIIVCRLLEIWESMPVFFMLLMVVALTQTKSVFLVIGVIGIFGWPGFSRYVRGEFFKQRNLPYVEACKSLGFGDQRIMFLQLLPNAIPPLLTLMPFAIMGAISTEAGLSFLGLGEENSCSWGVLMDEGRSAFPGEAYLLWPPAILLTILLVAIALVGDALRDALDPKLSSI